MPSIRLRPKPARLVLSPYQSAETTIGQLSKGCRIFGLTKGQFSILDLIRAVIAQTGPARIMASTWTAGMNDTETAKGLLAEGSFTSFRLLIDRSFARREPENCARLEACFGPGSIRCTNTHAKFATIENDRWSIAIRSSMNLNRNPRFEQFDLDEDPAICAFLNEHVDQIERAMPEGLQPTQAATISAFDQAWSADEEPVDLSAYL